MELIIHRGGKIDWNIEIIGRLPVQSICDTRLMCTHTRTGVGVGWKKTKENLSKVVFENRFVFENGRFIRISDKSCRKK